jgi:hypothetical protein
VARPDLGDPGPGTNPKVIKEVSMAKKTSEASANRKLLGLLEGIRKARASICDVREAIYERAAGLHKDRIVTDDALDQARLELEEARIELFEADIAILKAKTEASDSENYPKV